MNDQDSVQAITPAQAIKQAKATLEARIEPYKRKLNELLGQGIRRFDTEALGMDTEGVLAVVRFFEATGWKVKPQRASQDSDNIVYMFDDGGGS